MKRTAEMALANLEMRIAKLEKAKYQKWIDVEFKTTSKGHEIRNLRDLKIMMFQLNSWYDPDLEISGREIKSIETSLSRPIKRIIQALKRSGEAFRVNSANPPNLIKKKGSEEVTLTFESFHLGFWNPFLAWQDANNVEVKYIRENKKFYGEAEHTLNHSFEWLYRGKNWEITYNPVRGTLRSNIPLLLKASFAKSLSKHLSDYQENEKLIVKAIHEGIASWSEDFVKGYGVENFDGLVEDYAEAHYRRPYEDEDWCEYGGRESALEAVWEEVVLVAKKVSGLEKDPERPVFLFLIDFDPDGRIAKAKKSVALVKWDFTRQDDYEAEYEAKWGTMEKMRSLYNKS